MIPCIGKGSPGFVLGVVIEEDRQTGAGLLCRGLKRVGEDTGSRRS